MHDSWHVQDADEDEAGAALNVDWRAYAQTHTLTDRQRKLADKIKKRENRIAALQKEVDKIRVRTTMRCLEHQALCHAAAAPALCFRQMIFLLC